LTKASGIAELCDAVEDGRLVARALDMETGIARLSPAQATDGVDFNGKYLLTIHGPRYRMLVIGAGQLSRYLCNIAVGLDYQVTVCDPREEYTDEWNVPGTKIVRTMPDDTVLDMTLDERCAVIALTHDPKLDDLALMEALKTPAFYVGALGSRRNNAARRERLKEFDLTETELARLHGPVGIYIGSRTPPEIAVSILAEVTAVKNGVITPPSLQVGAAKSAQGMASSIVDPELACFA
jgi:xanthine dehydrogenase accessory factor